MVVTDELTTQGAVSLDRRAVHTGTHVSAGVKQNTRLPAPTDLTPPLLPQPLVLQLHPVCNENQSDLLIGKLIKKMIKMIVRRSINSLFAGLSPNTNDLNTV